MSQPDKLSAPENGFGPKAADTENKRFSRRDDDFMPAALEVLHRPPAPYSRAMLLFIIIFSAFVISWAVVGKMDIVVTAPGKVVPMGKVKVIQPLETGIVRKIHVHDGQQVQRGDPLIELDSTENRADRRALEKELLVARMETARLTAQMKNQDTLVRYPVEADEGLVRSYNLILQSARREYRQRILTLNSEIKRTQAEMETLTAGVHRLEESVRLSEALFAKKKRLADRGIITNAEYIQAEIEIVSARKSLQTEKNRLTEAQTGITKAREQKQLVKAEYRHQLLDEMSEAEKKQGALSEQLVKITSRQVNATLKAPVNGIVQQLAIHTIGGVATAAQPLMVVVPLDGGLEVQANVLNKDIGFVDKGQAVSVKVDAYPFTRHGDLEGVLEWVGKDSVVDQTLGPVYPVRVSLQQYEVPKEVNGRQGEVSPGMTVTADIRIGRRRIIEYFLGPILRYKDRSLRER